MYTSKVAVTEFVEATMGSWVQEVVLAHIHHKSVFS